MLSIHLQKYMFLCFQIVGPSYFAFEVWVSPIIGLINSAVYLTLQEKFGTQQQPLWDVVFSPGSQLGAARQNDVLFATGNRDTIVLRDPPLTLYPLIQVNRGRTLERPCIVLRPPSLSSLCTTPVSMDRSAFEWWPWRESGSVTRDDWVVSLEMEADGGSCFVVWVDHCVALFIRSSRYTRLWYAPQRTFVCKGVRYLPVPIL